MSFMLYDPVNRNVDTYEYRLLGKNDAVTSNLREAVLFATQAEAINKRDNTAHAADMVPVPALDMTMHAVLIAAIRRTWDVIAERAFEHHDEVTLTAEQVRSFVMDYIENQSPGSHTRRYFWMPLEPQQKNDYLREAFNEQEYSLPDEEAE